LIVSFTHYFNLPLSRSDKPRITREKYELLSEKCANCGKSKKEIEKVLKEGKQPSNEEIVRRMKEAGLRALPNLEIFCASDMNNQFRIKNIRNGIFLTSPLQFD